MASKDFVNSLFIDGDKTKQALGETLATLEVMKDHVLKIEAMIEVMFEKELGFEPTTTRTPDKKISDAIEEMVRSKSKKRSSTN